jgi:catechol 2,3-dioxygenase-like lactoylglutathione lyase family enzyme
MPPKTNGILESSLYVSDVSRSLRFYQETFGFRVIRARYTRVHIRCGLGLAVREILGKVGFRELMQRRALSGVFHLEPG